MSKSKRARHRSGLFSLSARVQRREAMREGRAGAGASDGAHEDEAHEDDGCPICVAQRTGGDVLALFPGRDGSAPTIPTPVLESEARKAMAEHRPGPDELVPFMTYGSAAPGGGFVESSFSVDGSGRVFWISWSQRRLVLEMPRAS